MIHFFPTFSVDADQSPLGEELRQLGVPYRIFAGNIRLDYRNRLSILLAGYPKLAWFALRSGWRSMVVARPRPDALVVGSDVEVLVFALLRWFLPWDRPRLVFQGFIYTRRRQAWINWLRGLYYGRVLACCECIICHSRVEVPNYRALFPRSADHFVFIPWGAHVDGHEAFSESNTSPNRFRILAAGRSGRDYPTLGRAVAGGEFDVTLICDSISGLGGVTEASHLRILRHCYGQDYLAELRLADVVVLPLAVDDISAGQMVMIQAMAYGKPVIVTRTPTVDDYLTDGVEGLLVPRGDPAELRAALIRLQNNPALRRRLGAAGRAAYLTRFSQRALLRSVVDAANSINVKH